MSKKKLILIGMCVAMVTLAGCSSGPTTAPNGMNLYLDPQFDEALLIGENQKIDFEKLIDVSDHGGFTTSDQYAVELVSTTKFSAIRDAFAKVKGKTESVSKLDRQLRLLNEFEPYRKSGVSVKEQFNKYLTTLNLTDFVDAQVAVGSRSRQFFTETKEAGRATSPLRIQQATISGAWRAIGYAQEAAANERLGRPQDADVDGFGSDAYFQTQGCDVYIDRAIAAKKKNQAMGDGVLGAVLRVQSMGGDDGDQRSTIWSEGRCNATFQAIPAALTAYKAMRKRNGTK